MLLIWAGDYPIKQIIFFGVQHRVNKLVTSPIANQFTKASLSMSTSSIGNKRLNPKFNLSPFFSHKPPLLVSKA